MVNVREAQERPKGTLWADRRGVQVLGSPLWTVLAFNAMGRRCCAVNRSVTLSNLFHRVVMGTL